MALTRPLILVGIFRAHAELTVDVPPQQHGDISSTSTAELLCHVHLH